VATTADVWLSSMVRLAMGRKNNREKTFSVVYLLCVCWSKVMVLVLADPVRGGATVYG